MSVKRKNHNSIFKTKVALEAIRELNTIGEIAARHEIHPNMVSKWKTQLVEGASEIFEDKRKNRSNRKEVDITEQLYQQIGQMKVENDFLKKKFGL
jgi:transposase-like protein